MSSAEVTTSAEATTTPTDEPFPEVAKPTVVVVEASADCSDLASTTSSRAGTVQEFAQIVPSCWDELCRQSVEGAKGRRWTRDLMRTQIGSTFRRATEQDRIVYSTDRSSAALCTGLRNRDHELLYLRFGKFSLATSRKPHGPSGLMKADSDARFTGTVVLWSEEGFGHIRLDQEPGRQAPTSSTHVFVHRSQVSVPQHRYPGLVVNDRVKFSLGKNPKSQDLCCIRVTNLENKQLPGLPYPEFFANAHSVCTKDKLEHVPEPVTWYTPGDASLVFNSDLPLRANIAKLLTEHSRRVPVAIATEVATELESAAKLQRELSVSNLPAVLPAFVYSNVGSADGSERGLLCHLMAVVSATASMSWALALNKQTVDGADVYVGVKLLTMKDAWQCARLVSEVHSDWLRDIPSHISAHATKSHSRSAKAHGKSSPSYSSRSPHGGRAQRVRSLSVSSSLSPASMAWSPREGAEGGKREEDVPTSSVSTAYVSRRKRSTSPQEQHYEVSEASSTAVVMTHQPMMMYQAPAVMQGPVMQGPMMQAPVMQQVHVVPHPSSYMYGQYMYGAQQMQFVQQQQRPRR